MFGNYSIATASCHPSSLPFADDESDYTSDPYQLERARSPYDRRTSNPSISLSISQLSQTLGRQQLNSYDTDAIVQGSWTNVSSKWSEAVDDDSSYVGTSEAPFSSARVPRCLTRRVQRQRDVRALCDPAHLRSISELVERMITNGDQCGVSQVNVASPIASAPSPGEEPDNYINAADFTPRSGSTSSSLGRRASSASSAAGFSISKEFRVQKRRHRNSTGRERR